MKIGILTLPLHTNYGGILQAFALQTVLELNGHDVKIINRDRTPQTYSYIYICKSFIRLVISSIKRFKRYNYYNIQKESKITYENYLKKTKYTRVFIDKYIHNYWVRNYNTDINPNDFDVIVVGSDQIWNHKYASSIGGVVNAFLPSLNGTNCKRFSYAASFGKDTWEYTQQETELAKSTIKGFSAVSVRETTGMTLCKNHLDVEASLQLDPTLLLEANDYINYLNIEDIERSSGNMLVYLIDSSKEKDDIVDYLEDKLSLTRFVVNSKVEDNTAKGSTIEECIQPPVEKWLRGFMDAEFVVTDSFHACVFSILFHKPFVVIGNEERGLTRFTSLLNKFQLGCRMVSSLHDIVNFELDKSIDYDVVDRVLKVERMKSLSFLKENLR